MILSIFRHGPDIKYIKYKTLTGALVNTLTANLFKTLTGAYIKTLTANLFKTLSAAFFKAMMANCSERKLMMSLHMKVSKLTKLAKELKDKVKELDERTKDSKELTRQDEEMDWLLLTPATRSSLRPRRTYTGFSPMTPSAWGRSSPSSSTSPSLAKLRRKERSGPTHLGS